MKKKALILFFASLKKKVDEKDYAANTHKAALSKTDICKKRLYFMLDLQ